MRLCLMRAHRCIFILWPREGRGRTGYPIGVEDLGMSAGWLALAMVAIYVEFAISSGVKIVC
jgi:hypothetical protein